ncbi:MAG: 3'-5' exonuclease [Actinomycetota bacterium]
MTIPRLAVLDLETSGLRAARHRILQAATITIDADGHELGAWSSYVRLRWPLQRVGPRRIHGIRRSTLRGAPRLGDALAALADALDGTLVAAHHAAFDVEFVRAAALHAEPDVRARLLAATERSLCTLEMSRATDPDRRRSHRLTDVCRYYDITIDRPHDARCDARATAALVPILLAELGVKSFDQLEPFLVPAPTSALAAAAPS